MFDRYFYAKMADKFRNSYHVNNYILFFRFALFEQSKGMDAIRDSTFMFGLICKDWAFVIVYQSNNAG